LPSDCAGPAKQRWTRASRKRLDDLNELLGPIALLASEFNKLLRAGNNSAAFSRSGDSDPTTAAELEQPLLAQQTQSAEDGVPVHTEHGCEVARRRQALARPCLTLGDGAPQLGSNLIVESQCLAAVDLDLEHGTRNTSFIPMTFPLAPSGPGLTSRLHALIGEARRRARRRRARYGAFVLASLALAGGLFFQLHRGSEGTPGTSGVAGTRVKGSTEPGTVLLAKRLIPKGTSWSSIAAQNLFVVITIPKGQIAPRAISDPAVLQGRVAAADIYPHQQLETSDFTTAH
jgi:hypothetical protein